MSKRLTRLLLVASILLIGSTISSAQEVSNGGLREAVTVAAHQAVQGRRVELDAGTAAPFDGILLDDAALLLIASDRESLWTEVRSLRAALNARIIAAELDAVRVEMWRIEAKGTGWDRFTAGAAKWGFVACAAGVTGAVIAGR